MPHVLVGSLLTFSCTVTSAETSDPLWSVDLVSFPDATSDESVTPLAQIPSKANKQEYALFEPGCRHVGKVDYTVTFFIFGH